MIKILVSYTVVFKIKSVGFRIDKKVVGALMLFENYEQTDYRYSGVTFYSEFVRYSIVNSWIFLNLFYQNNYLKQSFVSLASFKNFSKEM